ncbi:MAG: iron ABC transporter permease [Pseudomonadales bacterium]|nr:iron ABC transporter permease [Pseudomonadales bacterium]
MRRRGAWSWPGASVVALALLVLVPILVLVSAWHQQQWETWQHLLDTVLWRLVGNTLFLMVGVTIGVLLLGVSLAWCMATLEFPGRRWLQWALLLPMAMPAYVLAFVMVDLLDYAGPIQTQLRQWWPTLEGFSARHPLWVVVTLSLVLYPYVYMLARLAFQAQGRAVLEQARILGQTPLSAFFNVAIPMARPGIAAGLALALMETLADFGAVSVFNFDTFTTAIYKSWYGLFNLQAAAQLASLLLLFVVVALWLERRGRSRARYSEIGGRRSLRTRPRLAWGVSLFAFAVLFLAFLLPVARLLYWVISTGLVEVDGRFISLIWRTFLLGAMASVLVLVLASWLAWVKRHQPSSMVDAAVRLATLGYALPGSVLAVGIMVSFSGVEGWLDTWGLAIPLVGSLAALLLAYVVRFLAVAFGPVENALQQVRPRLVEAARTLGASSSEVGWRVYLPMMIPGLFTALLLAGIDVMKEMPATLLLRPFGWDTLAVRIYELTAEGEWQRAAAPSLTLVLLGLVPVIVLSRKR